ncbi:MAG: hypothetical protein IRZ16_04130 [Myxococcaceae bacterium]|nr:hypothetical protein [Myxococcaceae bacterium]
MGLYVLAFPYHPALRSPNELCRLWQTRALVDFHTLSLNRAIATWGWVGDLSRMGNTLYPSKAPLLSFLDVPVYAGLRLYYGNAPDAVPELALVFWSRLFITVLPTLLMLILVRRFLRTYLSPRIADGLTATYALGTLAFSYSLLFMSHQTTAVLVFSCFYVVWRCLRGDWCGWRRWAGLLLAGALGGATVAAEYTGALPVLAVYVWACVAVVRERSGETTSARSRAWAISRELAFDALLTALGALPFLAFLMWYHARCFGGPFESGYKHLNDPGYQPWHLGGFLGIRYPDPRAFMLSYFSPLRGLFTLAPFLLFAPFGALRMRRQIREALRAETPGPFSPAADRTLPVLVWLLLAGYTYFTSSFAYDSWGWTTGPRHLTPLVPFLLLPVGLVLEMAQQGGAVARIVSGIAAALCAGAVIVTGTLSLVNYIPDSVSNAFFALAVPLFRHGYLPPSVLGFVLPNPWSGTPLLVLVAVAAVLVFVALTPRDPKRAVASPVPVVAAVLVLACYFGALALSARHDARDAGALRHLQQDWVQPVNGTIGSRPSAGGPT